MSDVQLREWIEEIKKGNVNSFSYIVEKYQTLAFNIALSIVKEREDAEEVVQDSFVKIYRFLNQYNGESRFSSWFYKIVYNTALTRVNSNARAYLKQEELRNNTAKEYPSVHIHDNYMDETIRNEWLGEAIDQLADGDRLIVTLFYFGEKSIPEIAEITSWKISKCKVKLMRARTKLAEILKYRKADLL